jgi:hypothetical protein
MLRLLYRPRPFQRAQIFGDRPLGTRDLIEARDGGLNGSVVNATDCYPKGARFDSRVMLGVFPLM